MSSISPSPQDDIQRPRIRNVYGEATKERFVGIRVNNKSLEAPGLSASCRYLAYPWDISGGVVGVISTTAVGSRSPPTVQFKGHKGPIQDICFSPFYDSLFATGSDDSTVKIWEVPSVTASVTRQDAIATLSGHIKKILSVCFNPVADWILASASQDGTVRVWNAETMKEVNCAHLPDAVSHLKWNYNGSLLGCISKDKNLRVIDPRAPTVIATVQAHEGSKSAKLEWMGGNIMSDHYLVTAGFEKGPGREFALWDIRAVDTPVQRAPTTLGAGSLFPFWDGDTGLLLLPGRGDGNIRFFEVYNGAIHPSSDFRSTTSARGFCVPPKRAVDVTKCEIMRCYKQDSTTSIQPIQFIVPRRSQEYQPDLYPPCLSNDAALTAQEWCDKRNADPLRTSMTPLPDGSSPFSVHTPPTLNVPSQALDRTFSVTSVNSTSVLQRQLTKVGTKIQELDATVMTHAKEAEDLRLQLEQANAQLASTAEALKEARTTIDSLQSALEALEKEKNRFSEEAAQLSHANAEFEALFSFCRTMVLAAAEAPVKLPSA